MSLITLNYVDVFDENKEKQIEFSKTLLDSDICLKSLFVLRVDGQSMEPLILDRSLVIADLSQKKFKNESIFIVSVHGKFWVKKAKLCSDKKKFVSLNKKFSHLVYDFDEVRVIAKVLLTFTKL